MNKRFVSMFFVLLLALATVSAGSNLKWSWENTKNPATYFRYQLDGGEIIDTTDKVVYSDFDGKSHTLQVWQSFDNENWSEPGCCTFDPDAAKLAGAKGLFVSVAATPYTWTKFDFQNELYDDLSSSYGFGLKADARYQIGLFYAGASLSYEFEHYKLVSPNLMGVALDGFVGVNKAFGDFRAFAEVGGGVELFFMNGAFFVPEALVGMGGEYTVAKDLAVKAEVLGKMGFHGHEDANFAAKTFGVDAYVGVSKKF